MKSVLIHNGDELSLARLITLWPQVKERCSNPPIFCRPCNQGDTAAVEDEKKSISSKERKDGSSFMMSQRMVLRLGVQGVKLD